MKKIELSTLLCCSSMLFYVKTYYFFVESFTSETFQLQLRHKNPADWSSMRMMQKLLGRILHPEKYTYNIP